ncbi:MAG TPA: asparagine synthase (glutamine-hydrolyzing) [Vicinamibacteria bacterium]|nr:asparagine synthase (glutamine-hydrolyzing) [Vicinamibacteria bacterium]
MCFTTMCGLCGFLDRTGAAAGPERARAMAGLLAHRGPDGEGVHLEGPLAFGHRRLSIIDLSERASEPMSNEDGSLWLVFNGEIYNFRELRKDLEKRHRFRSDGDGEVILHLYAERGEEAVKALDGMFALALWDVRQRKLLVARDRAGKKPLFYHDGPGLFAFASEVKALLAHPDVPKDKDPAALPLFLTYGYVPTPGTFYRHIRSLPPGQLMVVTEKGTEGPRPYWDVRFTSAERNGPLGAMGDQEAEERFRTLLRAAVKRRLVSDVPLGAFLSGGLDSSSVVAFMAQEAEGRVKTFCIGFQDGGAYDERAHARVVAQHFGTEHTEFVVEPKALELIDRLVWHHDGPFGDSSAVPTYLLSELTRGHVTVALNGDGGDEVFAGYLRFYGGDLSERIPTLAFKALRAGLGLLPEPKDRKHLLRFAKRFAEAGEQPLLERYLRWNAYFTDDLPALLRPEMLEHATREKILASFASSLGHEGSVLARLLELNFKTYLLDDLNVKMDRMSMAHGLETRSPFLDTALVEFGASLPDRLRMRLGKGKLLLRRAMKDILPASILERGKMGFGAPLGAWFRSDLGPFVKDRLLDPRSPIYDYLQKEPVARMVADHMAETADLSPRIWALLTLESWLRQERDVRPPSGGRSGP